MLLVVVVLGRPEGLLYCPDCLPPPAASRREGCNRMILHCSTAAGHLTRSLVPVSLWSCFHSSVPFPWRLTCHTGTCTSPMPSAFVILSQSKTCSTIVLLTASSREIWRGQTKIYRFELRASYGERELLLELRIESFLDGFSFHFWVRARHQIHPHKGVRLPKSVHLLEVFALDDSDLELTFNVIITDLQIIDRLILVTMVTTW